MYVAYGIQTDQLHRLFRGTHDVHVPRSRSSGYLSKGSLLSAKPSDVGIRNRGRPLVSYVLEKSVESCS